MNLRDLECFFAVADERHFRHAAERLFVSQAMVSQSVRRLERDLGGALFDRSTRMVSLTPLGDEFLRLARPAYDAMRSAYEVARGHARQLPDVFVLAYARDYAGSLLEVVRASPASSIELRNMPTPAQVDALRRRRINAALGWETPEVDFLETEVVTRTGFVAIVPCDDPLAGSAEVRLADVAARPVVGWPTKLSPELSKLVTDAVDPAGGWSFASFGTSLDDITAHVLAGRGVGVFPASLVGARLGSGVRGLDVVDSPVAREVLAWRRGESHPSLDTVRAALRSYDRTRQRREGDRE